MKRSSFFFLLVLLVLSASPAFALPMKPNIKSLLQQAQRPKTRFVPARAGWNGPEEKSAITEPNPAYDELRREPSATELRAQLFATAVPDWRILLAIAGFILAMRAVRKSEKSRLAPVYAFPATGSVVSSGPEAAEAA